MKKTAVLLPFLLTACFPVVLPVANPSDGEPNIYGAWRISEINGRVPADLNAVLTLNSSDQKFAAVSECHRLSGEYHTGGSRVLGFGKLSGENQCAAEAAERNLADGLLQVRAYRFNRRQLELLNAEGRVVLAGKRLRTERAVGPSDLGQASYFSDARRN